jgi:Arc/MetJ-type ribon-helix-helix transcriptional regulator
MGDKLVNISINVPDPYLKEIEWLIMEGRAKSKSEFLRSALDHYLSIDRGFILRVKARRREFK